MFFRKKKSFCVTQFREIPYFSGVPLDNTTLYLLNQNYQPVKNGDIGELFVSGYNLAAGYVAGRDPEKFINNPFTSNSGKFFFLEKLLETFNFLSQSLVD